MVVKEVNFVKKKTGKIESITKKAVPSQARAVLKDTKCEMKDKY